LSTKIGIHIGGRQFNLDVDDAFGAFLLQHMEEDFNMEGNNDSKAILHAYVKKTHDLYKQEKKIGEILEKIS